MFLQQINKPWVLGEWLNSEGKKQVYNSFKIPEIIELMTLEEANFFSHRGHVLKSLWDYQNDGLLPFYERRSGFRQYNSEIEALVFQAQNIFFLPKVGVRGIEEFYMVLKENSNDKECWSAMWGKDVSLVRIDDNALGNLAVLSDDLNMYNLDLSRNLERFTPDQLFKQAILRYNDWRDEYGFNEFGKF